MSDLPNAIFFDHDEAKACRDNNRLAVRCRSREIVKSCDRNSIFCKGNSRMVAEFNL